MYNYIKYFILSSLLFAFAGCDLANNQKMVNIDGQEVDKRFFNSQAISDSDSQKTKEFKRLLLNKKFYRVYPYAYKPYITEFSNYFDESGAQKSANIIDGKEQDITFEQFKIQDYHITIEYYDKIECDLQGVDNDIITLKCSDGTWKLAPSLEKAKQNMSDCQKD